MAEKPGMIPTILLTGFLGAGKTTLLNRLIEFYKSQRTVLLINEFGKVGIDGEMLVQGNYEKVELNKGSLFCICVRTDFIFEVEKIATQIKPDLLIVEATGLADTTEMEKMLALPNLKDYIELQACLCVVDCQNFMKIKDNLKAPASQIRSADLVLVNKTDLVSESQVADVVKAVKAMNSTAEIIETQYADFPLDRLTKLRHPDAGASESPGEGRPDPVISVTLEKTGTFSNANWDKFRETVDSKVMRLKGFVSIENQVYFVDATSEMWSITPASNKDSRLNRFVIIGQDIDEDEIEERFLELLGE